jgi:hypothetical protein
MNPATDEIKTLLRGEPEKIKLWLADLNLNRIGFHVGVIVLGTGLYGAAMGWWRSPTQALYVALKFPLIILLTSLGNALLNAMLAPLLGLNISFRQSFMSVLMSFTITGAILGSFSPLVAFLVWNAPPMSPDLWQSGTAYAVIQLTHVVVIAFAGIIANARLYQLLVRLGGSVVVARRVLLAWLAVNLFLGSQLSWILRPFIGSPNLPVEFLRPNAFQGNFYETVFSSLVNLLIIE